MQKIGSILVFVLTKINQTFENLFVETKEYGKK